MQRNRLGVLELKAYMQSQGIQGEILNLDVVTPTVESAAKAVGAKVEQIIKSILFVIDDQPVSDCLWDFQY